MNAIKKIFVSLILFWGIGAMPAAAKLMKDVFSAMPDSLMPLLTKNDRLDCVDFMLNRMKAAVTNRAGGTTELTALKDAYLRLVMSPSSVWEMRLVPYRQTELVVLVKTYQVDLEVYQSDVELFTSDWKPLPLAAYLHWPTLADFRLDTAATSSGEEPDVVSRISPVYMEASLSDTDNNLRFKVSLNSVLEDTRRAVASKIRKEIVYAWDGQRFQKE